MGDGSNLIKELNLHLMSSWWNVLINIIFTKKRETLPSDKKHSSRHRVVAHHDLNIQEGLLCLGLWYKLQTKHCEELLSNILCPGIHRIWTERLVILQCLRPTKKKVRQLINNTYSNVKWYIHTVHSAWRITVFCPNVGEKSTLCTVYWN